MRMKTIGTLVVSTVLLLGFAPSYAQGSVEDNADVWAVVEEQWNAVENEDRKWPDRMLSDDFVGWGKSSPAPRSKASTKMWLRFNEQMGKMVAHELYPLSIVINDDVAVAHYLYTSANQSKDGDIETTNGRYTDILVRTDDGWKFLAWHGGDDKAD